MLQLFTPVAYTSWIVPVFSTGFFVLLVLWIRTRAGSAHFLLDRLWRIAAGRREVEDSVLRDIQQESRDLEIFRFSYRMPVQSRVDLHKLNDWAKARNIGMLRLKALWRWVDVRNSEVVLRPHWTSKLGFHLLAAMLWTTSLIAGSLLASSNGYFQMKESKVWFMTDANTVRNMTIWGDSWVFAATECAAESPVLMQKTGFRESELLELCRVLASDSMKDQVHSLVKQQRWLGLLFLLPSLVGLTIAVRAMLGANAAEKLWKELHCASAVAETIAPSEIPPGNHEGSTKDERAEAPA